MLHTARVRTSVLHRVSACVATTAILGVSACGTVEDTAEIAPFRAEVPSLPLDFAGGNAEETVEARPEAAPAAKRTPKARDENRPAEGAPTDAEIAAELREAFQVPEGQKGTGRDIVDSATLTPDGLATIPPTAPPEVRAIIHAGNQVARKPYVYGGGHGRFADSKFIDTAYDCSGSISYAFASAGLVDSPLVSGDLARFGEPGPGKWITIYANGGHVFMTVAGLRFDTSGRQRTGSRWQTATRSTAGFTVRHPKGL